MRRSLTHYWRTHLAVICGAAVTTGVLTGALVVGDSLRGSLRDLTLERLGLVDWAVLAERPFRRSLADDLAGRGDGSTPSPALTLRASATEPASGARASEVALWGVDPSFFALHPSAEAIDLGERSGPFPSAAVNRALAAELGVEPGDQIVLAFQRPSDIPRETLVGREESTETIEVLRLTVGHVFGDRGLGGFGLEPRQTRPLNVFVDLRRLQRAVLGRGSEGANVLLGADRPVESLEADLAAALSLEDVGWSILGGGTALTLQSSRFVVDDALARWAREAAAAVGADVQPVLTYLVNSLEHDGDSVPYSTIAALDPPPTEALGPFRLADGTPAPSLGNDEILLNRWAAEDLGAEVGDEILVTYYVLGARDELLTESRDLVLRGVVEMEGLAVDPHLTPEFPGIQDADDMAGWNPPFPIDLDRIRPRDEDYWDDYRAAPKAFVSLELGRELWASRFGSLTSLRLAAPAGVEGDLASRFAEALRARVEPREAGFQIRPLREEGLRAARGATDFAGLFLGLSLFLIVSAALLSGLLFRLGVERRASEVGLLRATGFPHRRVRKRFLAEGVLLAALGAVLGLAAAAGYAWALLAGLRSWWLPAIGEPVLYLHLEPLTLAMGAAFSILVVFLAIAWSLRRLGRVSTVALLAGSVEIERDLASRRPLWVGWGALAAAAALTAAALAVDARTAAGIAFGVGAALLTAGIAFFAHFGGRRPSRANGLADGGAVLMAARNSTRNRARSLLSVTLMASASFVIVVVAANRLHPEIDVSDPASGAGGFSLVAETDVPVLTGLGDVSAEAGRILSGTHAVPFRVLPGEDVSCLNLYQPERPRLLGAPPEMIARGGFAFQQTIEPRDNPWTLLEEPLADGAIPAIGDYNSVLWILHSGLGEDIVVENERGEPVVLRLVGLLGKSLFQSELVISEAAFQRHFPSLAGYSYFLLDPDPARATTVATELEAELERLGFDAVSTRERLASFQAVEDTYLSTFQTLGGLGLLLGTLGMGVILLRNVLERRAELATLRALGFRRARLRNLVLAENALLLAIGLAVGALAGAVAAAPHLLAVGEGLPWAGLGLTLAAVFALGMLSSVVAVRAVARLPLLASLRAK